MRLGISSSLCTDSADIWAKHHAELGLKSVVFPLNCEAPDSLVDEFVAKAKENDLLIAEVGIWRNALSSDPEERRKNLEYSINQLRLADRIGARCCVNVAGSKGSRWDGGYRENFSEDVFKETVRMIQTVIDEAAPKHTYFTIESMPWMIPTGPEEYLRLMDAVNRDRFSVHLDIINMINSAERYFFSEEFLNRTFELLGSSIKSCHLKDIRLLDGYTFQLLECACGEGTFNIKAYERLASQVDPDMPMIIEHLASDEEYRESVAFVKKLLQ